MHQNTAVTLEHEQPIRQGQVRRQTTGIVNRAAGNNETHLLLGLLFDLLLEDFDAVDQVA